MTIVQQQIEQGLAILDTEAILHCGIVIDKNGLVSHLIHQPISDELAQKLKQKLHKTHTMLSKPRPEELRIGNDPIAASQQSAAIDIGGHAAVVHQSKLLRFDPPIEPYSFKDFIAIWLDFDADRATHNNTGSVSANEFRQGATGDAGLSFLGEIAAGISGQIQDATHKASIKAFHRGAHEVQKQELFDAAVDTGLSLALRDYLIQYLKSMPTNRSDRKRE